MYHYLKILLLGISFAGCWFSSSGFASAVDTSSDTGMMVVRTVRGDVSLPGPSVEGLSTSITRNSDGIATSAEILRPDGAKWTYDFVGGTMTVSDATRSASQAIPSSAFSGSAPGAITGAMNNDLTMATGGSAAPIADLGTITVEAPPIIQSPLTPTIPNNIAPIKIDPSLDATPQLGLVGATNIPPPDVTAQFDASVPAPVSPIKLSDLNAPTNAPSLVPPSSDFPTNSTVSLTGDAQPQLGPITSTNMQPAEVTVPLKGTTPASVSQPELSDLNAPTNAPSSSIQPSSEFPASSAPSVKIEDAAPNLDSPGPSNLSAPEVKPPENLSGNLSAKTGAGGADEFMPPEPGSGDLKPEVGSGEGLQTGGEDGLYTDNSGFNAEEVYGEDSSEVMGYDATLEKYQSDAAKADPNTAKDASKKMDENGEQAKSETEAGAKKMDPIPYKVVHYNYAEYALLIWEALKENEIEDATREVTVRGAEAMQGSQGSQGGGASGGGSTTIPVENTAMSGTSIGGAAGAMINLLKSALIDLSLLSEEIEKGKQQEMKGAVQAQTGKSQSGVDASETGVVSETTQNLSTSEYKEIKRRRNLLLAEWATAATQIGEGSNAISSDFYSRSAAFSAAANAASGSLGGINAITDTDRFVLFEQTRAAALSAIELGLQGAVNLNDLEDNVVIQEDSSGPKPGTDISSSSSQ